MTSGFLNSTRSWMIMSGVQKCLMREAATGFSSTVFQSMEVFKTILGSGQSNLYERRILICYTRRRGKEYLRLMENSDSFRGGVKAHRVLVVDGTYLAQWKINVDSNRHDGWNGTEDESKSERVRERERERPINLGIHFPLTFCSIISKELGQCHRER